MVGRDIICSKARYLVLAECLAGYHNNHFRVQMNFHCRCLNQKSGGHLQGLVEAGADQSPLLVISSVSSMLKLAINGGFDDEPAGIYVYVYAGL
ncbi:hypothetical protein OIU84_023930 [Salix udensis]|uniref:Uncharacterized protein n=1 Tax=Salix udensis TaxID=889485 RepID=A0AAD6NMY9_9ROSI|nr:hypothetical protein OIU84_023930 [Salix udensis]